MSLLGTDSSAGAVVGFRALFPKGSSFGKPPGSGQGSHPLLSLTP